MPEEHKSDELKFTFTICYQLLKISSKTFLNWLKKAKIDPEEQRDKFDPRKKYLYKSQLVQLAAEHARQLPESLDDYADEVENASAVTIETLAEQLAAAQRQHAERFDQIDRALAEIALHQHDLQALPEQTRQQIDQLQQLLAQVVSSVEELQRGAMEVRSNGTQKAEQQQEEPELVTVPTTTPSPPPVKALPGKPQARSTKSRSSTKKKKSVRGKKLPAGLVLLRDFAGQHHIVTEHASKAGEAGKIKIVQGRWLVNSRWAREALDAQGRHDFYEVFHERKGFTPCEQCPHNLAS